MKIEFKEEQNVLYIIPFIAIDRRYIDKSYVVFGFLKYFIYIELKG